MKITSVEFYKEVKKALNLPDNLVWFTLNAEVGRVVSVECEYFPDVKSGEIKRIFKKYKLIEDKVRNKGE